MSLFSIWTNLIGDPATHLWKSSPKQLFVSHNSTFIQGSNNFQVLVEDIAGNSVENIIVTLYAENENTVELQLTSLTNSNGIADFVLENNNFGTAIVTTRAQDYIPVQTNLQFLQLKVPTVRSGFLKNLVIHITTFSNTKTIFTIIN